MKQYLIRSALFLSTGARKRLLHTRVVLPTCSAVLIILQIKGSKSFCDASLTNSISIDPSISTNFFAYYKDKNILNYFNESYGALTLFLSKLWLIVVRSTSLCFIFSPCVITSPVLLLESSRFKSWWWDMVRECLRISGPCCSKLAQWISSRPDLFHAEICNELKTLQSFKIPPNFNLLKSLLTLNFGEDIMKQMIPIDIAGSGCVAQVYYAKFNEKEVAIKLIHPNAFNSIKNDLFIMQTICQWLELIPGIKSFSLSHIMTEFSCFMSGQLNLINESNNLIKFSHNFHHISNIEFPIPYIPFVTDNILIESYIHGVLMSDMILSTNKKEKQCLAKLGLDLFLKMVYRKF